MHTINRKNKQNNVKNKTGGIEIDGIEFDRLMKIELENDKLKENMLEKHKQIEDMQIENGEIDNEQIEDDLIKCAHKETELTDDELQKIHTKIIEYIAYKYPIYNKCAHDNCNNTLYRYCYCSNHFKVNVNKLIQKTQNMDKLISSITENNRWILSKYLQENIISDYDYSHKIRTYYNRVLYPISFLKHLQDIENTDLELDDYNTGGKYAHVFKAKYINKNYETIVGRYDLISLDSNQETKDDDIRSNSNKIYKTIKTIDDAYIADKTLYTPYASNIDFTKYNICHKNLNSHYDQYTYFIKLCVRNEISEGIKYKHNIRTGHNANSNELLYNNIMSLIKTYNIVYFKDEFISTLSFKNPLRFDIYGYLITTNNKQLMRFIIEYDEKHHFKDISVIIKDILKEYYCWQHGISILRIYKEPKKNENENIKEQLHSFFTTLHDIEKPYIKYSNNEKYMARLKTLNDDTDKNKPELGKYRRYQDKVAELGKKLDELSKEYDDGNITYEMYDKMYDKMYDEYIEYVANGLKNS